MCEDREAVEDDNDDEEYKGDVGGVWLEAGLEDEVGVAVDVLCDEGFAEAEVGDENADPGEEGRDGRKSLEPVEDGRGPRGDSHEGQEANAGSDENALYTTLARGLERVKYIKTYPNRYT